MMAHGPAPLVTLLLAVAWLGACGRELELEPRMVMTAEDMAQSYQVTILATAAGATSYTVSASFVAGTGAGAFAVPLPAGDTLTVNGVALSGPEAVTELYTAAGSGNPGTFTFVWTQGGTTRENVVTASLYTPAPDPTTVSKSGATTITVPDIPAGVTVSGSVNAGAAVKEPFFAVPIQVTGGGAASPASADLSSLAAGPGVLVILETATTALQAPTAAGGAATVTVQFGYNVTIGD